MSSKESVQFQNLLRVDMFAYEILFTLILSLMFLFCLFQSSVQVWFMWSREEDSLRLGTAHRFQKEKLED